MMGLLAIADTPFCSEVWSAEFSRQIPFSYSQLRNSRLMNFIPLSDLNVSMFFLVHVALFYAIFCNFGFLFQEIYRSENTVILCKEKKVLETSRSGQQSTCIGQHILWKAF
jgi:hypothetical protein